jgi:hypothetical protein
MNELQIGQKIYYYNCCEDILPPKSGYYTIDSEEMTDYGGDTWDEYYYVKELQHPDTSRDGRQRMWKNHIKTLDELIVCSDCGGLNIRIKTWLDPNTGENKNECSENSDHDLECLDCENIVTFTSRYLWEEKHMHK